MDKSDDTARLLGLAEYSPDMHDDTVQLLRLMVGMQEGSSMILYSSLLNTLQFG